MTKRGVFLCAGVVMCLFSTVATAQIKPKIYILFDTSGSMLQNKDKVFQNGDGSPLCTNDGLNSRVSQLKVALFDALQGMGATEVDFALATFPMFLEPNRTPYCPIGKRNPCANDGDCVRPGETCGLHGWPISTLKCLSPCEELPSCSGHYKTDPSTVTEVDFQTSDVRYGCKISTHDPATQQVATCGDASDPCSPWYPNYKQEVLKVPFGSPPEDVMLYFDQQEDHPLSQNPEVRVGNGWWTPLGKSLFYAHGYFHKEIALPATDYRKKCERLTIAFFTDGGETCNKLTDSFWPTKWAAELLKLGVVTHTVAINTDEALLSQIASNGGGSYVEVSGSTAELKKAFLDIIAESLPPAETCNGEDDDCDNQIDEDFPQKGTPCSNGLKGACFRQGVYVCTTDGLGVVCDAEIVSGTDETCNGIDDDCDGEVDEIPGCLPCVPQPEVCNGVDDDCDSEIDEDIASGPCGSTVGECLPGTTKCENGKMICDGGQGPVDEICDGLDNDCDTVRDGFIELCYPFSQGCDVTAGSCQPDSQCVLGTRKCDAKEVSPDNWTGEWGDCLGAVGPDLEICDGIDNDCDGQVDEEAECPGESQCINGMCTSACAGGEFVCPVGQVCTNGWCVLDTCNPAECKEENGVCKGGECIDLCKDVSCGAFEECVFGRCVDNSCYQARPCPAGQSCVQGECVADPCEKKKAECKNDEFCLDGACHTLCEAMDCPEGQDCRLVGEAGSQTTKCVETGCAKPCEDGYVCVEGTCDVDPCEKTPCEPHEICISGKCFPDPCEKIDCPATHVCKRGSCVANITALTEILATGGGGCACNVAGNASSSMLLLLTLLMLLLSDRRRRRR